MTNLIKNAVARKILSEFQTKGSEEWFTELRTVKQTMVSLEQQKKKRYPGFENIKFLHYLCN